MNIIPDIRPDGKTITLTALQDGPGIPIALNPLTAALQLGIELPLYVPWQSKPVAGVSMRPDGTIELHKTIAASIHLVTSPRGIAFDCDLFARACGLGATVVKVSDRESGDTYATDVATFERYSFTQDRQHGAQRFLKLQFWSINGQAPAYGQPADPAQADLQPALFGGAA